MDILLPADSCLLVHRSGVTVPGAGAAGNGGWGHSLTKLRDTETGVAVAPSSAEPLRPSSLAGEAPSHCVSGRSGDLGLRALPPASPERGHRPRAQGWPAGGASLQGFWVQVLSLSDARTRTFCQSESRCVSPSAPGLRPLLAHGPSLLSTARVDFAGKGTAWKKRRFGREDASSFVIVLCTPHCNGPHDSGINFGMKF